MKCKVCGGSITGLYRETDEELDILFPFWCESKESQRLWVASRLKVVLDGENHCGERGSHVLGRTFSAHSVGMSKQLE